MTLAEHMSVWLRKNPLPPSVGGEKISVTDEGDYGNEYWLYVEFGENYKTKTFSWETNRWLWDYKFTLHFQMTEGCCGIFEMIRPHVDIRGSARKLPQKVFNHLMEGVMYSLSKMTRNQDYDEVWGNQMIVTSSSESNKYYQKWVKGMGAGPTWEVDVLGDTKNPRTGNKITTRRVVFRKNRKKAA